MGGAHSPSDLEITGEAEVTDQTFAGMTVFTIKRQGGEVQKATICEGDTLIADTVGRLVEMYGQHLQGDQDE